MPTMIKSLHLSSFGANSDMTWTEPVMAGHQVMITLLEAEWLQDTFGQSTHLEEAIANDANDVVVLGMKRHLHDGVPLGGQVLQGGDDFVLFPEKVDQTKK